MTFQLKKSNYRLLQLALYTCCLNLCVIVSFFSYWYFFLEIEEIIIVLFFSLSITRLFLRYRKKNSFNLQLSIIEILYIFSGVIVTLLQFTNGIRISLFNSFYYLFYGVILFYLKTYFKYHTRRLILLNALTLLPIILFVEYILINQLYYAKISLGNQFLKNPGITGNYVAALLPFVFILITKPVTKYVFFTKKIRLVIPYLSFSILLFVLVTSQARAAWIGAACAVIYMLYAYNYLHLSTMYYNIKSRLKHINKILFPCLITISIFLFITFLYKLTISLFIIKRDSAIGRIHIYKMCLLCIKKFYLTGCGISNSKVFLNTFQANYFSNSRPLKEQLLANNLFECFNSFLQTIIEGGVLLAVVYIIALYYFVCALIKVAKLKDSSLSIEGAACVITVFISSMFSNPFNCIPILIVFILSLSVIPFPSVSILKVSKFYLYIAYVATASAIFTAGGRFIIMCKWYNALSKMQDGYDEAALTQYNSLSNTLKNNGFFLYNYGAELYNHKKYEKSLSILKIATDYYNSYELYCYLGNSYEAKGLYREAEKAYIEAGNISPHTIYPKFLLFKLYKKMKLKEKAIKTGELIIKYPLKVKNSNSIQMQEEITYNLNQLKGDTIRKYRIE